MARAMVVVTVAVRGEALIITEVGVVISEDTLVAALTTAETPVPISMGSVCSISCSVGSTDRTESSGLM